MAMNAMLRRQAAEHAELIWEGLVCAPPMLDAVGDALRTSDSALLVCEMVQYARLVLRLGGLLCLRPPGAARARALRAGRALCFLPAPGC
eukprot:7330716-Prymnesium_polylepis.1